MPLIKRDIQPAYISRVKLQKGLVNEFESVSVSTLGGIIRQISSLAKYSEDVFSELINEAESLHKRATSLQVRISGLAQKVTQLDSSVEEISLQDINVKKAFKCTIITDQQVVGRATLPKSMNERYTICEAPPRLQDMNPYRDDGKDALKFYTDPTYFFELWSKEEMKKEQDRKKKKKRRDRKTERSQSQVLVVKHIKRKVYSGKDKELDHSNAKYSIQENPATSSLNPPEQNGPTVLSPEEPVPYDERRATTSSRRGTAAKLPRPNIKPPPPPPVPSQISDKTSPQPPPNFPPPGSLIATPPPPPPPDPSIPAPPPPPIVHENHIPGPDDDSWTSDPVMPPAPKPVDTRTDLLDAIKQGMKLRKVQGESEKKETVGMDVASILQRRIAVEYSDTESETGSEWDDDEDEWEEGED